MQYLRQGNQAALVVWPRTLVVNRHETITLEVCDWHKRGVDRKLTVVHSETVTVCVGVREKTRLEDGVGGGLDTRDKMRRRESSLSDRSS